MIVPLSLSLGDQEIRTKNPFLMQTENCTKEILSIYKNQGIETVFELNPGNHFRNTDYRLAKGIA
ncbi:MAG: hypothetical protein NC548_37380 [Lachnospiraceae bacterium]|nr:hypothetical protein [Lachnospiraceae bacterium]MCM1230812.1 hypothetical protein [Ruminococcus flavefaciens]